MNKEKRGFTLIELMVVVAIMGILAAIAVVGFGKYRDEASKEEAKAFLSVIKLKQEAYSNRFGDYVSSQTAPSSVPSKTQRVTWPTSGIGSFQAIGAIPRKPNVGWQYSISRFTTPGACTPAACCAGLNNGVSFVLEAKRTGSSGTETLCTNSGRDGIWEP